MLGDLYQNDTDAALDNLATLPPERAKPVSKWNGWSAPLRAVAGGVSESAAFVADSVKGYGQTMAATGTASAGGMFSIPSDTEQRETEKQRASIAADGVDTVSNLGRSFRNVELNYRPDPATASTAERLTYDLTRFVTKAVGYTVAGGGAPGAVMLGADEGMKAADDLGQQGVDKTTRTKVGALTGAAAAAGVLLPVAAPSSYLATAGLWAAGGPGAFMAQQSATRSILKEANYKDLAEAYDPLDPVGLAVSSLVPAGFAAYAMHNASRASRAQAAIKPVAGDSVPLSPESETQTALPVTGEAQAPARAGLTPDEVDAVMTHNLTLAQDVREATAPREAAAIMRGPQPRDPNQFQTDLAVVEVPLERLQLSADVPQFKGGADVQGVVDPLGGTFDRTGVAPIQVWERLDGTLEVISGRHRRDLAIRSGEATIPGQIHREADGFTAARAAALDAELNIRDGQGKVGDYVQYFQGTGITRAEADARGLLARSTGQRAFTLATDGGPELIAAHRAGQLSDDAAVSIARAAPGDARLQAVGQQALQDGKPITQAVNLMQAVRSMMGDRADTTGDLFGFDDSAMKEAGRMAALVSRKQRELGERLSAVQGAAKRPELAKREGVNIEDPQALQQRITDLQAERAGWDNWSTNPARVAQIREELGMAPMERAAGSQALDIPPARELAPDQRLVEQRFTQQVLADVDGTLDAYAQNPATRGGKVVNTDLFRDLSPDYAASKEARSRFAAAVHEPSSWLAREQYARLLARPPEAGSVMILGGGGGSGKSTSLDTVAPGYEAKFDAIYDTTLASLKKATEAIEAALATGRTVLITYTARDPLDALVNGVIPRAERDGRTVPLGVAAQAHQDAPKTLAALAEKYATDDRVKIQIVDNTRGPGQQRFIAKIPEFSYNDLAGRAYAAADQLYENTSISQATHDGLVSGRPGQAETGLFDTGTGSPGVSGSDAEVLPFGRSPDAADPEGGLTPPGGPDAANDASLASHKDPFTRSVLDRAAEIERTAPDMVVGKDANGDDITVAQELARIRRESLEGTDTELGKQDAGLVEVAANCALTLGGGV